MYSFIHSFIHACMRAYVCSFVHSFNLSFILSFVNVYLFVCLFVCLLIYLFIYLFIHSFLLGCTTMFTSENKSHPLETLDLSNIGSKRISSLPSRTNGCSVKSAEYLNITWKNVHKRDTDTFNISRIRISLVYEDELRVGT